MNQSYANATFKRRLAAIFYDAFFVVAIWILSTMLLVALIADGGEVQGWPFQVFLYVELFAFYYIFWRIKGQTLGMQVWKIKAVGPNGDVMDSRQCILRFLAATVSLAPFGAGLMYSMLNRDNLALHDLMSSTRVVYLGKRPYESEKLSPESDTESNTAQ